MAVEYITKDGASLVGAEKIKVVLKERDLAKNPWISSIAVPDESEALKTGGSKVRFLTPLGYELPTRRGTKPMTNAVTYHNGMDLTGVDLIVSNPFDTPAYAFQTHDAAELDGINFSPTSTRKVTNVLYKNRIKEVTNKLLAVTSEKSVDLSGETSVLDVVIGLKDADADYDDISETNGWSADATRYFDGQAGVLEERYMHLHPKVISALSNVNTEAGAGSELQFLQFEQGQLKFINGTPVVKNKNVPVSQVWIMPTNIIGQPDTEIMKTQVIVVKDELHQLDVIKGIDWFDCVVITPELITKITLPAAITKMTQKQIKEEAAKIKAEANKAVADEKAELEKAAADAKAELAKAKADLAAEKAKAKNEPKQK